MPRIRPVSDLRNNFSEISRLVHEADEPVFLTKNGYGDMVVMSVEQYDALRLERRIDKALREAERTALSGDARFDFDETAARVRKKLTEKAGEGNA